MVMEDMLCFSVCGMLSIKTGDFPVTQQRKKNAGLRRGVQRLQGVLPALRSPCRPSTCRTACRSIGIRTESWPAVAAFTLRAACCHGVHSFGQTLGAGMSHTQRFSRAIRLLASESYCVCTRGASMCATHTYIHTPERFVRMSGDVCGSRMQGRTVCANSLQCMTGQKMF